MYQNVSCIDLLSLWWIVNILCFSDIGARFERDAFDTLFDHAPDKLNVVKKVGWNVCSNNDY